MQETLKKIDRLLELKPGTLSGEEKLDELASWDSLSVIGFIALADEKFSVRVSPAAIHEAETVNDLIRLLEVEVVA